MVNKKEEELIKHLKCTTKHQIRVNAGLKEIAETTVDTTTATKKNELFLYYCTWQSELGHQGSKVAGA